MFNYKFPKDYLKIIDNIYDVLSVDDDFQGIDFYKYITANEKIESLLQANKDGEEFQLFKNTVICLGTGDIRFNQDIIYDGRGNQIKSDYIIDVTTTNADLPEAKKQALILCELIRQTLLQDNTLNDAVYEARVKAFIDLGFIKYPDYDYHYGYRIPLDVTFR